MLTWGPRGERLKHGFTGKNDKLMGNKHQSAPNTKELRIRPNTLKQSSRLGFLYRMDLPLQLLLALLLLAFLRLIMDEDTLCSLFNNFVRYFYHYEPPPI